MALSDFNVEQWNRIKIKIHIAVNISTWKETKLEVETTAGKVFFHCFQRLYTHDHEYSVSARSVVCDLYVIVYSLPFSVMFCLLESIPLHVTLIHYFTFYSSEFQFLVVLLRKLDYFTKYLNILYIFLFLGSYNIVTSMFKNFKLTLFLNWIFFSFTGYDIYFILLLLSYIIINKLLTKKQYFKNILASSFVFLVLRNLVVRPTHLPILSLNFERRIE